MSLEQKTGVATQRVRQRLSLGSAFGLLYRDFNCTHCDRARKSRDRGGHGKLGVQRSDALIAFALSELLERMRRLIDEAGQIHLDGSEMPKDGS